MNKHSRVFISPYVRTHYCKQQQTYKIISLKNRQIFTTKITNSQVNKRILQTFNDVNSSVYLKLPTNLKQKKNNENLFHNNL